MLVTRTAPLLLLAVALATADAQTEDAPAQPPGGKEEVRKPTPMNGQELKVIRNLETLTTDRLQELLTLYGKLDNQAMVQIVARELLRRNPNQPDVQQVLENAATSQAPRPANYTELLIAMLDAGRHIEDADAVANEARRLAEKGQGQAAVRLLEKLRRVNYPSGSFPFLEDLASAYQDAGQRAPAEQAYKQVLADPASSEDARESAKKELADMARERHIEDLRSHEHATPGKTLQEAEKMLKESPNDAESERLYLESLIAAGRPKEAIQKLEALRKKAPGAHFAYLDVLADAYYEAGETSKAAEAYAAVRKDPQFDKATQQEAAKKIAEIHEDRSTGKGGKAEEEENSVTDAQLKKAESLVEKKQFAEAKAILQKLISDPHTDSATRKDAKDEMRDLRQDMLIEEGNKAIKDGRLGRAKEIAQELTKSAPHDKDVRIYQAEVQLLEGHAREAYETLTQLKKESNPKEPFVGQETLADSMNRLGQWENASEAYQAVRDHAGSYEADDVFDATLQQRNLQPYFQNSIKVDLYFVDEEQGQGYHEEFVEVTPWWNQWRAVLSMRLDQVTLHDLPMLIPQHSDRPEGQIAFQRRFDDGYFVEASVGGAESNVLYGARFGRMAEEGISWWVGYAGNARAADYSLPLEVLNARENRLEFSSSGELVNRYRYDLDAFVHWISVDRQSFGTAYSVSGNFGYVLQTETATKPDIAISYAGEYTPFVQASAIPPASVLRQINGQQVQVRRALAANQELRPALPANYGSEIYNNLIQPTVNRQGIQLTLQKHLFHQWDVRLQGEVYYEFYLRGWNYTVECGLDYWINPRCRLFGEVRYDSAGRGPDSGQGQGTLEATVGAAATF